MNQQDIIKEKGKDGKVIYKLNGQKIETYTEDLYEIFSLGFENLRNFFYLLIEKDPEDTAPDIGKELVESTENKMIEMIRFIDDNHGRIDVERAGHSQGIIRGTMLGVIFKPNNKKAPVTEPSQKDSSGA